MRNPLSRNGPQLQQRLFHDSGGWLSIPPSVLLRTSRVLAPAMGRQVTTTTGLYLYFLVYIRRARYHVFYRTKSCWSISCRILRCVVAVANCTVPTCFLDLFMKFLENCVSSRRGRCCSEGRRKRRQPSHTLGVSMSPRSHASSVILENLLRMQVWCVPVREESRIHW